MVQFISWLCILTKHLTSDLPTLFAQSSCNAGTSDACGSHQVYVCMQIWNVREFVTPLRATQPVRNGSQWINAPELFLGWQFWGTFSINFSQSHHWPQWPSWKYFLTLAFPLLLYSVQSLRFLLITYLYCQPLPQALLFGGDFQVKITIAYIT